MEINPARQRVGVHFAISRGDLQGKQRILEIQLEVLVESFVDRKQVEVTGHVHLLVGQARRG